jgi:alcohol dehydrogenase (cytochrome c)
MRTFVFAAAFIAATSTSIHAQTHEELVRDGNGGNTDHVLTYGMGYHQQRYSPLKAINKDTVRRLVPVWSLSLNNDVGEQGQPYVYNGVMYVSNVKQTVAIDVLTGRQLWATPIEWEPAVARVVCCGLSNRGVALYDGKVFVASIDAHLKALDAKTGKQLWKSKVAEWKEGYSITSAPLVVNGVVMTGMTGGEYGVRGFVAGFDVSTRKGPRNLASRRLVSARRRVDVDHGLLRSRARSHLLGHEQRRTVGRRLASRRQSVGRFGRCDAAENR